MSFIIERSAKKLKVLILHDYAFVEGGAGKVATESAIYLANKNHEVVFFSAVGPVSQELNNAKLKNIICLEQEDILSSKNKIKAAIFGISNKVALNKIEDLIKFWKPDIAHIHVISKALSWSVINYLNKFKIPVVYTLHDFGLLCPNMGLYNFKSKSQCNLYDSINYFRCLLTNCDKRSYSQKLWRWLRFIYSRKILKVLNKISGFIAVSNFEADVFSKFIPEKAKLRVIYNPVSDKIYCLDGRLCNTNNKYYKNSGIRNNYGKSKNIKEIPQFVYIGRLSEEKGIDLMINAIKHVDGRLVIVGEGELVDFCRKASEELGVKKVRVIGRLDEKQVAELTCSSEAIILPSKVMETAGMAVVEAARYGIPAVVSDHGGLREFVKDNVNGIYFKSGDLNSLINAMQRFIDEPGLSKKLGRNAQESFQNYKGKTEAYINSLEELYYNIIKD
ncbi:MAG: glycosyltransferase family 4 protein [Actinobacteria bacterium]|nr:glycosyltransferase family 4 protein [Actinomycetota bacterium]